MSIWTMEREFNALQYYSQHVYNQPDFDKDSLVWCVCVCIIFPYAYTQEDCKLELCMYVMFRSYGVNAPRVHACLLACVHCMKCVPTKLTIMICIQLAVQTRSRTTCGIFS